MQYQKLSVKGMAMAGSVLWAGAVLFVIVTHRLVPGYGQAFLEGLYSIYPRIGAPGSLAAAAFRTLLAFLDGAIAGALLAWLYNFFSRQKS